ncbi:MAG TPA: HdeD family acid-resistance protein [Clostridiales bacterium]|nr:HdeD family acid-resistance protein [Clostridiales bacterium]
MQASKSMRILNIISGVLLIVAGIYCLCNQDVAAMTAGLMIGVFMLVSGVIEIIVFASTSGLLLGSGWLLLDGVLTVILSLFLLFNQWFTLMSLPFLFTLWLLFSGISRFVSAFDLRAVGVRGWGWVLAMGIILMIAGFVCMMDPWVSVAAIGLTVGLVFLLEGVNAIVYACVPRGK